MIRLNRPSRVSGSYFGEARIQYESTADADMAALQRQTVCGTCDVIAWHSQLGSSELSDSHLAKARHRAFDHFELAGSASPTTSFFRSVPSFSWLQEDW